MIQITPLGHACFQIAGDGITVITDPFDAATGQLPADLQADIVTTSHEHHDHNATDRVGGDQKRVFDWPGEYEVGGAQIRGFQSWHDDSQGGERGENTIFVFRFEEMSVAHLGDLGHELSSDTIEKMGQVDVLLIPVGGTYTIDAKKAKKVVDAIEPRVVVPMHFSDESIKVEGLAPVADFFKEMGKSGLEQQSTLKLKKSDLPIDGTQIIWLQK